MQVNKSIFDNVEQKEVIDIANQIGGSSLNLAFALASVRNLKLYTNWNYKSFGMYLDHELCDTSNANKNILSKAYAYGLADVGTYFYDHKDEIEKLMETGQVGISYLLQAAKLIKNGADENIILAIVLCGDKLPEPEKSTDPEQKQKFEALVKNGDADLFMQTLVIHAFVNELQDTNESLNRLVLSEFEDILDAAESKNSVFKEKYLPLVIKNKFYCQCCLKIPFRPNIHHVLPVSIGQGFGPRILLCEECHLNIVQPQWEKWCETWVGEGSVEELKKLSTEELDANGKIEDKDLQDVLIFPR